MITDIFKGENKLIEYELLDSSGAGILFTALIEATVTLKDYWGTTKVYTKTGGGISQGSTTTSIEFEVTESDLDGMDLGLITATTKIQTSDADFASNEAVQVRNDELLLILN